MSSSERARDSCLWDNEVYSVTARGRMHENYNVYSPVGQRSILLQVSTGVTTKVNEGFLTSVTARGRMHEN